MQPSGPRGRFESEPPTLIDLLGRIAADGMTLLKEEGQLVTLQLREVLLSSVWSLVKLLAPLGLGGIAAVLLVIGAVAYLSKVLGSLWAGALVAGGALLLVSLVGVWIAGRALGRQTRRSLSAPPEVPGGRKDTGADSPRLVPGDGGPAA